MTEDKFAIINGHEVAWDGISALPPGTVVIGRNPVYTAEEIAQQQADAAARQANQHAEELIAQNIRALAINNLVDQGVITTDQQAVLLAPLDKLSAAQETVKSGGVVISAPLTLNG